MNSHPTAEDRQEHSAVGGGRFPIANAQEANSALHLRGHGTTPEERKEIIRKAAEFVPDAAHRAAEADKLHPHY